MADPPTPGDGKRLTPWQRPRGGGGPRFPARLHVLLARDAPVAVVLRTGPARRVCALRWDRTRDALEVGQWMGAKIYAHRADISPDGEHWLYFALNGRWQSETRGSYSVLARVPFLKALVLWPQGDTWGGGGLFLDRHLYACGGETHHVHRTDRPVVDGPRLEDQPWFIGDRYGSRLLRDGWRTLGREAPTDRGLVARYVRDLPAGWALEKDVVYGASPRPAGKGLPYEEHRLVRPGDGRVVALPDWEWADLDRHRLVWAARGCLMASELTADGLSAVRLLHDLNDMTFERLRAPY